MAKVNKTEIKGGPQVNESPYTLKRTTALYR